MQMCRALGLALRGLLAKETRILELVSSEPCLKIPSHLPNGCAARRCRLRSLSGVHLDVVLGGPSEGGEIKKRPASLYVPAPHDTRKHHPMIAGLCFTACHRVYGLGA